MCLSMKLERCHTILEFDDKNENSAVRRSVATFYDDFGWKRNLSNGRFLSEDAHEDFDACTQVYMRDNELRYQIHFSDGGRFFLDAGCGAKPRRLMSRGFRKHVCVDVSYEGLLEARKCLGDFGLYVIADLVSLPFKKDSFDGVLAAHCLYHIDKDLQVLVIKELYRVAKCDKNILLFYSSNQNLLSILQCIERKTANLLGRLLAFRHADNASAFRNGMGVPKLYFYAHEPMGLVRSFKHANITCLRTLTQVETRRLKKMGLLKVCVAALSFLESRFPYFMRHIGKFLAIKIQKVN